MKILKKIFVSAVLLCFSINLSLAQKMYNIHQDNVKPSKLMDYEKIAKEFNEACKEHNVQMGWLAATTDDLKYLYISPIEKMADLDKQPFADMAKAMGDKFGEMFKRFDECYDSHGNYIIVLDEELSYMPDGITQMQEGQNHRKWVYMYYKPKNAQKVRDGFKAVKKLFETKNSPEHYRVYSSGFGTMESFYMVAISSKDEVDAAQRAKANQDVLGSWEERWEVFSQVMNNTSRMEEYNGDMRPDLSYTPK